MTPKRVALLCSLCATITLPAATASAESFSWTFAGQYISGSGTLVATPDGNPGEYLITGGSGTITAGATPSTFAVSITPCSPAGHTCVYVNSDGAGANPQYDNLLYPDNTPGSELTGNGVFFEPGADGTAGIEVADGPPSYFYNFSTQGYNFLSTPFTVTALAPSSITPEPSSIALLGTGLIGIAGVIRRRLS